MKYPEYPTVNCYVPKGFDATKLKGYNKRHHYKYGWAVHTILLKHIRSKSKFDEPIVLSGEVLQELFGSRYYPMIIQSLIAGNIIQRFNYREGEHAFKYKIKPHVLAKGIEKLDVDKVSIRRRIHLHRDKDLRKHLKNPITQHEFSNLTFIEIDAQKAIDYIDKTYKKGTPKHTTRIISVYEVDKMKDTQLYDGINTIDWLFTIDRSGRWHTPISHLAKDLRQFLKTTDGKRFVELDGACSQLTFCHKYLLEHISQKVSKQHIVGEDTSLDNTTYTNQPNRYIEGYKPIGSLKLSSYDVTIDVVWRNAIFSGNAYQLLMDGMEWKKSRDDFKTYFFKNLFFNKYNVKLNRMEKAFKYYFPHEFQRLRTTKKHIGNRELAVQVQRYESLFWHNWVGSTMRKKFKHITYATIHDSILLPKERVNEVKEEILRQSIRFFNPNDTDQPLIPTIRIKE